MRSERRDKLINIFRESVICILDIAVSVLVGFALLIGAYSLPTNRIVENVGKSAAVMEREGLYPSVFPWCTSKLDNFTDSLMLTEAADTTDSTLTDKALMVYRGSIEEANPHKVLEKHYAYGEKFTDTVSCPRYWHGYLIFLKPLLEITHYANIRIINGSSLSFTAPITSSEL